MSGLGADVVIAGGGPAGLMLAIELRLAGVTPVVLEELPQISQIPKGNGLVGQIVPLLDYRGLLEPLRASATYAGPTPGFSFGPLSLDFASLGDSPLDLMAMPQRKLELHLTERLQELGGAVRRGHEVLAVAQDADSVTASARSPDEGEYELRARYLVGCDGAHSLVRKQAGIGFPGITSTEISRIGRVRLPPDVIDRASQAVTVPGGPVLTPMQNVSTATGAYSIAPLAWLDPQATADIYIVSTREEGEADSSAPLTLAELQASVRRVIGADLPMSDPLWLSRIVGNSRQADRYQQGRILLAGDAAHVFGLGGSLNAGLMDSLNLGWKLAAEISGWAPPGLLASYHAERHAAGRRTLMQTRAQRALSARGEISEALREVVGELVRFPDVVRHLGELIQGSDLAYGAPGGSAAGGHPLTGRVAPDLQLTTASGSCRVAELMRAARPALLDFTPDGRVAAAAAGWAGHVPGLVVKAPHGRDPADGLLIRPDGYVAWASGPAAADPADGLQAALRTWFGSPDQPD